MKFRFWGVRGLPPSPGPRTVRYGGNTTCIEVRSEAGATIILDAGTGLYALAHDLMARRAGGGGNIRANIFITHEIDAGMAGADALYCTHHEPTRSDDELEAVFADALSREGLEVAL